MKEINPDYLIIDLIRKHPRAKKVLAGFKMMCTGCGGSEHETIRHAAQNHGVPLSVLLEELKAAIKSGS